MHHIHFQAGRLPGRAVLGVSGPEAGHFLHNLLTSGIEGLAEGDAAYAALLSPQGKILFDMFVERRGEGYLIDCASSQRADLAKRLTLYKLRAKIEFAARDDLSVFVSLTEIAGGYLDPRTPEIGWRAMVEGAGPEAVGYDGARVALGLADSEADLGSGEFFPHEANLDQLAGVNFAKGCYVGQEVVSRMEHRGTARNRILPIRFEGDAPPRGTEIRGGDKLIGTVLSSSGRNGLALLRLDRLAEAPPVLSAGGQGVAVLKPGWVRFDVPGATS